MIFTPYNQLLFQSRPTEAALIWARPQVAYAMLKAYYDSNGLYDSLTAQLFALDIWKPGMKPLRNPVYRVVEFYAAHLWPGPLSEALPILTDNDKLAPAIQTIWQWSNWGAQKQVAARGLALYGDLVIKVVADDDKSRVYFQLIDPAHFTDFETDARGFLTMVRLDVPAYNAATQKPYLHTELWEKKASRYRLWTHEKAVETPVDELGTPKEEKSLSDFGIDFVPFVHSKFRDVGEDRGRSAVAHALDKIDEVNLLATRLHQLMFRYNKPTWGLSANATDASGRPLPPPRIGEKTDEGKSKLNVGDDDEILGLPGNASLTAMVPPLNYADFLAVLNAQMDELERDMPELGYYRLRDKGGELSGVAISLLLSDAVDRVLEARGNAETALVRANQMALTISTKLKLLNGIGEFEKGDFAHRFAEREVFKQTDTEKAATVKAWVEAGVSLKSALTRAGWRTQDIEDNEANLKTQRAAQAASLADALLNEQRNFDQEVTQ